jgi:hypothetical protein
MKRTLTFLLTAATSVSFTFPTFADYTILLKNGRQITVENFREEGGMIKFYGYGGEISIVKNQVQEIRYFGHSKRPEKVMSESAPATAAADRMPPLGEKKTAKDIGQEKMIDRGNELAERRAKEQEAYQQKIKEYNNQLQELRGRYASETRGNTGSDPAFFTTEEAFKGHQEDLLSRLRDAQYKAQGLPSGSNVQSPPFSTNPPPAYTEKQKMLSDLRNQINELELARARLISEMKQNGFDTDSFAAE